MGHPKAAPALAGYTLGSALGSGGYADVFLYEQHAPRMKVAIKILKSELLSESVRHQFTDEGNLMAQLGDHPHIVQVFRADMTTDGRPYLVMRYYPPPNLGERVKTSPMSVPTALRTGIQIASAIETAHRAGILHRDIKPANILVSQYGSPGLTDFGVAGRGLDNQDDDIGLSVPWSPPEVIDGESNGSHQSDVYSLSATLWHLLVGRSPFEAPGGDNSHYAITGRIRSSRVPATGRADVPKDLERLLSTGMAKDPAQRPRSALEFAQSLQTIEQHHRFARTDIILLNEAPGAVPMSGDGLAPATISRAPIRVVAFGGAGTGVSPAAPVGSGAGIRPGKDDAATVGRASAETVARPLPAAAGGSRRRSWWIVFAVLVVLGGAVGVLLALRDDPVKPAVQQSSPVGRPAIAETPGTPSVTGRRISATSVRFSWIYDRSTPSDVFRVEQFPVDDTTTSPIPITAAPLNRSITISSSRRVCIQVQVVRSGGDNAASSTSSTACAG